MLIDTAFDFRDDSGGRDPDRYSPTLRRYHRHLWSKPLPDGRPFKLDDATAGGFLHHRSEIGEFWLASDSVMQTFTRWKATKHIVEKFAASERDRFDAITYTIGGMVLFPGNRVDKKMTINGARGCRPAIADRMDLTLECIRMHYLGLSSPLADVLKRYSDFFALFGDFRNYVEFFLLQDLMTPDQQTVAFFAPFIDFKTPAVPRDVDTYAEFMRTSTEFVHARNRRIATWAERRALRTG
ncbi:MAG: DUF6994 family protein [Polyangiales bacterium]